MTKKQTQSSYMINQKVIATVERVHTFGVFVRLDDNTEAYIRPRELSWSGNQTPSKVVTEGEAIQALIFKLPTGRNLMELSYKRVDADPWDAFVQQHGVGDIVRGTVKDIHLYGILVEITPGVDGMIFNDELATWAIEKPKGEFWIGDHVEAIIIDLDTQTRRLRLSIRERMQRLQTVSKILQHMTVPEGDESSHEEEPLQNDYLAYDLSGLGRVLILDDQKEIADSLAQWLNNHGCQAESVHRPSQARWKIEANHYDLIMVDINLPEMDGVTFIENVRPQIENTSVIFMSIFEQLAERGTQIGALDIVTAFLKPLDLEEVAFILNKLSHKEAIPSWTPTDSVEKAETTTELTSPFAISTRRMSWQKQLDEAVGQVVERTGAQTGILFHMDPSSFSINARVQRGTHRKNDDGFYQLQKSPVRDVIQDGETIFRNQVSQDPRTQEYRHFQNLLDLIPWRSCIGLPIEAGRVPQYALFLFHTQPHVFQEHHFQDAKATSVFLGAILERILLDRRIHDLNPLLVSGQLAAGLSHEVFNKMSGLEFQVHNLHDALGEVTSDPSSLSAGKGEGLQESTEYLLNTVQDLRETVILFRDLLQRDNGDRADIQEALENVKTLLRQTSARQKVKITIPQDLKLPKIYGTSIGLQQAFLNILLNAIQQIEGKPVQRGLCEVSVTQQVIDDRNWVHIRFADSGPGIHRGHWEEIFKLGFSTRSGGTGMGMFITRNLIEAMGGRISVEESHMLIGTDFLVELPLHT